MRAPKWMNLSSRQYLDPQASLRDKIENGQRCDLFISANSAHTDALVKAEIFDRTAVLGLNPTVLVYRSEINLVNNDIFSALDQPILATWDVNHRT